MITIRKKQLVALTAAMLVAGGLTGCADDASGLGGTTGGTSGGTTTGSTGGGTTTGTTGGGSTGGTSGGTTGGTTGGLVCNPTSNVLRPIQNPPGATATGSTNGLCIGCSVVNPESAIDADATNFATLNTPVGLLGGSSALNIVDTTTTYPAGRRAGFVVFDPAGPLLTATLLQTVTVSALNNGAVQETADSTVLTLDLLGTPIIGTTQPQFLGFITTQPFNELRISFGSTANALANLNVVQACVSPTAATTP